MDFCKTGIPEFVEFGRWRRGVDCWINVVGDKSQRSR